MAAARYAWVLNLDADVELSAFARGAGDTYEPTRRVCETMQPFAAELGAQLLGPSDIVIDARPGAAIAPGVAKGYVGRAFCPTPRALRWLRRAGAAPEFEPDVGLLLRVNSRAFCAALGPMLPGARFVTDSAHARDVVRSEPPSFARDGQWRLKRAHGMAGRGQRVVRASQPRDLTRDDAAFIDAAIREEGGLQIEPNASIVREYAMHAWLHRDGSRRVGQLVTQQCDERGAWLGSQAVRDAHRFAAPATEPDSSRARACEFGLELDLGFVRAVLERQVHRAADALARDGYAGPFGLDAFVYRQADGHPALHVASELNARYSMGFAVGFGRDSRGEFAVV